MYKRPPSYHFVQLTSENLQILLTQSIKQKKILSTIYASLLSQSPDDFMTSMFNNMQATETKSMTRLEEDYIVVYGAIPSYTTEQADVSYNSFSDGILLALKVNSQNITFEREILDQIREGRLGHDLYDYLLKVDMAQQDLLNTLFAYYIHEYQL